MGIAFEDSKVKVHIPVLLRDRTSTETECWKIHFSRKNAQHLRLLRWSTAGVALFAFVFSLIFPLRDYVLMYQLITGAIYLAGSGAVIIGGLYWSKGTTAGAWSAMIVGGALAVSGLGMRTLWPAFPALTATMPEFPLNGAQVFFVSCVVAIVVYIKVSLLTSAATSVPITWARAW